MAEEHNRPARLLRDAAKLYRASLVSIIPETADWTWQLVAESLIANRMVIRNRYPLFVVRMAAVVLRSMVGPRTRLYAEAEAMVFYAAWGKESGHRMRARLIRARREWHRKHPRRAL